MLDAFLCKQHIFKYFARMLNSRDIKFANISENKILASNNESTVSPVFLDLCTLQVTRTHSMLKIMAHLDEYKLLSDR